MTVNRPFKSKLMTSMLAMPLLFAALPASAASMPGQVEKVAMFGGLFERPAQTQRAQPPAHVQLAQAGDPRVTTLEEQVRSLNGKIEELNFLILQMQEQLRKQQEDNEFRFQELEGGGGSKPASNKRSEAETPASETRTAGVSPAADPGRNGVATQDAATSNGLASGNQNNQSTAQSNDLPGVPQTLGSIRFDANGNLVGGTVENEPVDLLSGAQQTVPQQQDDMTVAALPSTDDPEELYRNSYEFILSGDYKTAEAGFRSYIDRFPDANRIPDANFWLGESLAAQKRHREAAEIFLATSREYPESRKAPDTLLKLGMSLSALKQREVACATFREVNQRHPNASDALKERVKQELASNGC